MKIYQISKKRKKKGKRPQPTNPPKDDTMHIELDTRDLLDKDRKPTMPEKVHTTEKGKKGYKRDKGSWKQHLD